MFIVNASNKLHSFPKSNMVHDNCVAIQGEWVAKKSKTLMISVYFPQELEQKKAVWNSILRLFGFYLG